MKNFAIISTALFLYLTVSVFGNDSNSANSEDTLLGVAGFEDVTPPVGVPLAGHGSVHRRNFNPFQDSPYACFLKPSTGILDPIRAKAFWIKRGSKNLLFLSFDLVAVTRDFQNELANALYHLGIDREQIFVSGTHTHNGPGNIARNKFWQIVAVDEFVPEIYYGILNKTVSLVERLSKNLEPIELKSLSFEAKGIQKNRRDDHPKDHFDANAKLLLAKNLKGDWLGGVINLPVHGTGLSVSYMNLSADVPGSIERETELAFAKINSDYSFGLSTVIPSFAFINGAEGDVAPSEKGQETLKEIGTSFAAQTVTALPSAKTMNARWRIKQGVFRLPSPRMTLKKCVDVSWVNWAIPEWFNIGLGSFFPRMTKLTAIYLDDQILMTWPGEATTNLGLSLKEIAKQSGAKDAWVLGLTNDHLSYFVTQDEFKFGGYESCGSFYGSTGGEKIVEAYKTLLNF